MRKIFQKKKHPSTIIGREEELATIQRLYDSERYWEKRGFHLSRYEVALTYMVIGGIPFYMDSFRPDRTMADNINAIYFNKDKARQEFKTVNGRMVVI